MYRIIKVTLVIAAVYLGNVTTSFAATLPLKVMVFNIEYGGYHIDFSQVIVAIKAADPDIILLEEADFSTQKVSIALGGSHPYFDSGMQIVSRYPLFEPHNAGQTYTFVEVAPGQAVVVSNIHLDDKDYGPDLMSGENRRAVNDIVAIENRLRLASIKKHLGRLPELAKAGYPVFIGGDFNVASHLDYTAAGVIQMQAVRGKDNVAEITWPVSKALEIAGFKDSYREIFPDPVRKPGLTWWAAKPFDPAPLAYNPDTVIQDRIDFIYSSGPTITVASAVVGESGSQAEITIPGPWPSDHRALVSSFKLRPQPLPKFIAANKRVYRIGEQITTTFNMPGANTDQMKVVLMLADNTAKPIDSQNITKTRSTVVFDTTSLAPAAYQIALLENKEITALLDIHLQLTDASLVLATDKKTYAVGEPISISMANEPGIRWSSIEVYNSDRSFYLMDYTSHGYRQRGYTETGTLTPDINNQIKIEQKLTPGRYTIVYYNSYKPDASIEFLVE